MQYMYVASHEGIVRYSLGWCKVAGSVVLYVAVIGVWAQ